MFYLQLALAAASLYQGNRASQESRRANKIQQRIANQRADKERREQIRQARIRRAQVINASAASGGQGSSSEFSAVQGINQQLSNNLNESYVTQALAGQASSALNSASLYQNRSNLFGTVGNFIANPDNQASIKSIFK